MPTEDVKPTNYVIQERIARGAESVLYRATNGQDEFCLKRISNWLGKISAPTGARGKKEQGEKLRVSYPAKVKHLTNEFEVGQNLLQAGDIPVVRMYALRRIRSCFAEVGYDLIMEYIDGDDLGDKKALKMLSLHDRLDYFYQATHALRYMHQTGYVHLDMKPSNVMVSEGVVKLIDFGVSMPLGSKPRSLAGTSGYLSPEQVVRDSVDEATDVFALGVTFAIVFGGKRLRQNHDELKDKVTKMEAQFHLTTAEDPVIREVPGARSIQNLEDLIRRCTIPRRDKRIRDTTPVINGLRSVANDAGVRLSEPQY